MPPGNGHKEKYKAGHFENETRKRRERDDLGRDFCLSVVKLSTPNGSPHITLDQRTMYPMSFEAWIASACS
jgi:hypothetical protein